MAERSRHPAPSRREVSATLVAALALATFGASAQNAAPTAPHMHVVKILNMQFTPAELTVKRGDRIVWINEDLFPHTATSLAGAFDSAGIASGASWTFTASTAGDYAYVCSYHPTMKGRFRVQ